MSVKTPEERDARPFTSALRSAAEAAATLVPLVAIIAGIGMMTRLPPASSAPIFATTNEAQDFFQRNKLTWEPQTPMILSRSNCAQCDLLRSELSEAGIQFLERNVAMDQGAARLLQEAQRASRDLELPLVVVNGNVVTPRVRSIRMAIGRAGE